MARDERDCKWGFRDRASESFAIVDLMSNPWTPRWPIGTLFVVGSSVEWIFVLGLRGWLRSGRVFFLEFAVFLFRKPIFLFCFRLVSSQALLHLSGEFLLGLSVLPTQKIRQIQIVREL